MIFSPTSRFYVAYNKSNKHTKKISTFLLHEKSTRIDIDKYCAIISVQTVLCKYIPRALYYHKHFDMAQFLCISSLVANTFLISSTKIIQSINSLKEKKSLNKVPI